MNVILVNFAFFAFLFPLLWEIEVAVTASIIIILAYRFFAARTGYAEGEQQENQEGTETPPTWRMRWGRRALMMGTHVTSTMQKGILVANVFNGKDSLLFAGLLSSLAAGGTWLQVK
ncbi:Inorganic phosphate transporter 2-1, chloroplastic [Glycine soja]